MKILVILTGGTIACKTKDNIMNTNNYTAYDILRLYNSTHPNNIDFVTVQPFTILSENYTSNTYNILIDYLYKCCFSEYDGVIITHGSDTLSYTSALVAMLLNNVTIPVVLTAADYPLANPLSNGLSNFSASVEFIKSNISSGIFTAYGIQNHTQIYLATRIKEADPFSDNFTECGNGIAAQVTDNKISCTNENLINQIGIEKEQIFQNKPTINNDILLLKTYPNQNFNCYCIDGFKAVIIYMYHSATACTVGNNTNILRFIEKCNNIGVDVHLASFKNKEDEYVTSYEIEKLKVNKLYNISKESAYIKALLAYNQASYAPLSIMNTDIYFEFQ